MTIVGAIVLVVIGGVCGSIGSAIVGYSHRGCLSSVVLGFVGAWVGMWFAHKAHLPTFYVLHVQHEAFPVVWSIIGAAVCAAAMSILTRRNPYGF